MRHALFVVIFLSLTLGGAMSQGADQKSWFKTIGCEKLRIIEHASAADERVVKDVVVDDADYIRSFQTAIGQLPVQGREMIKMGPNAAYLVLNFECPGETRRIEFYNHRIKTPATSFLMGHVPLEKAIWAEIQSHFAKPRLGLPLPKVRGREVKFPAFSIAYESTVDHTPAHSTATLLVSSFKVKNTADHAVQIVEVRSGQLPPPAVTFKVGRDTYELVTFGHHEGVDLAPRQMLIRKR